MLLRMKTPLLVVLTMWLRSPDGAVATDTDMSIDQQIIAAYDSLPQTNRSNNPHFVRVELDMLYRLDVWESMMREEDRPSRRKRRKAVRRHEHLWPNAVVPYELAASFSANDVKVIKNAMNDYEKYTCIRFREKNSNDTDFVKFVDINGCSSYVGRQLFQQELSLAPICRTQPIIIHELGHTIGLMHEHSRPDRDKYIVINERNIRQDFADDLSKSNFTAMDVGGIPYDYLSIMHYSERAGSNGKIVIRTRDPKYQKYIGKQKGLSFRDVKLINKVYRCLEQNQCRWKFCPGEGFVGQDCHCWCPSTNNLIAAEHCPRSRDVMKMELDAELNISRTEQWLSRKVSAIEMKSNRTSVNRPYYWPNATVPYINSSLFSNEARAMLHTAFEQFHAYSCLRFRERMTGDDDYLQLLNYGGCSSYVGRTGGIQKITLSPFCTKKLVVILHLLIHTVGVGHEHNRLDRDQYVTINSSNTRPDSLENFQLENIAEMYTDLPYDYLSIMHHSELAYSRNGYPTIVAKNESYQRLMGKSSAFSFGDVKRLNRMYRCAERSNCSSFLQCPGNGFVGQDCKCWCPKRDGGAPAVHCTECTDFEKMCALLSEYGFCTRKTFENYMKYTCPRSCRLCSPDTSA